MNVIGASEGKVEMFGLVRDKNGKPRIDDIHNIPDPIWDMLTNEEQEEIINGRNASNSNP